MGQDCSGSGSESGSSGISGSNSMSSISDGGGGRVSGITGSRVSGVSPNVLGSGHGNTSKDGNKGLHCEMY